MGKSDTEHWWKQPIEIISEIAVQYYSHIKSTDIKLSPLQLFYSHAMLAWLDHYRLSFSILLRPLPQHSRPLPQQQAHKNVTSRVSKASTMTLIHWLPPTPQSASSCRRKGMFISGTLSGRPKKATCYPRSVAATCTWLLFCHLWSWPP